MTYEFLRPEEDCALDDFESKITELTMKLDRDFGSFQEAHQVALNLYEKARPQLTDEEFPQVLKLLNHFHLLALLATDQPDDYADLQAELSSYLSGNLVWDETNRETVYLDHPNFTTKYPNFNGTL